MNARRLNLVLWSLTFAIGVCALVVVVWSVVSPIERGESRAYLASASTRPSKSEEVQLGDAGLDRALRAALGVSAKTQATGRAIVEESAAPPPVTLLGTIGSSLAIVRSAEGNVVTVGLSDRIDNATLTAIRPAEIDVEIDGRVVTVRRAETAQPAVGVPSETQAKIP